MLPNDFDHLIQVIYAGVCEDDAFLQALQLLANHHQCTSAAFVYADRDLPGTDFVMTCGPFSQPEIRTRYLLDYADLDPAPRAMAGLSVGTATATDRLFTPEFMARSRFVNEFYRPLGLEEALGGPVINTDGRTGLVAIHRGNDRPPFGDGEIETFGRFLPHFGQALRLRRMFFAARDGKQALAEALEPASQAVVILDPQAAVLHANTKARALFSRNDGLALSRSGNMKLSDREANNQLHLALASLQVPMIMKAQRVKASHPYVMRLCPPGELAAPSISKTAVLYIFDPDHRPADILATLQSAFGLSHQAAALVATLLRGGDLSLHAASAGVSRNTAKFHLNSAFTATGTARQVDLIQMVAGLLRDIGEIPRPTLAPNHATEIPMLGNLNGRGPEI